MRFAFYLTTILGLGWVGYTNRIGTLSGGAAGIMFAALYENKLCKEFVEIDYQTGRQSLLMSLRAALSYMYGFILFAPFIMSSDLLVYLDRATGGLDNFIPVIGILRGDEVQFPTGEALVVIVTIKLGLLFLPPIFAVCCYPSLKAAFRGTFSIHYKSSRALIAPVASSVIVILLLADILSGMAGYLLYGKQTHYEVTAFRIGVAAFFWLCATDAMLPKAVAIVVHWMRIRKLGGRS